MVAMTVLPIVIAGDPVLHNPTEPVAPAEIGSVELNTLIADMYETLDAANGVGLAANQVGVAKRLFIYDCPDIEDAGGERKSEADIEAQGGPDA